MTLLLTAEQVGEWLHLKRRAVLALDIPRVRIGRGQGKILFRQEDVELYIRSHVEMKEISDGGHAMIVHVTTMLLAVQSWIAFIAAWLGIGWQGVNSYGVL